MLCRTGDPVCFFLVVYSDVCARIGHCPFNIWSLIYYVPAEVFHVSKQTEMCLSHACRGIGGGPSASRLSRQHASNPMVSTQNPFFRTWLSTVAVWSQLPKQKHFFLFKYCMYLQFSQDWFLTNAWQEEASAG